MNEICCNYDLIKELKKLNPDVLFEVDETGNYNYIKIDCNPEELKLPEPFYLSEKNGITNKHKTKSGLYTSLEVI